ncbi:Sau3AI family type II restriction endonuclease [Campylobacterota bacterium DY0563]
MQNLPYDINNKKSIINYAKQLVNKSLRDICNEDIVSNKNNKGGFGQLLEKFYFLYEPNSETEPDFKEVNLELKSSPIKKLKRLDYVSKERLVLNIINYLDIVNEKFHNSSLLKKNKNLLLIFYLYEKNKNKLDFRIDIVDEWQFSNIDLEIIKQDWETIQKKIIDGKAHELSEGDTLYLGACTKGSKGGNLREQPFNKIKAKQRAFSLKQGYVNHIIATLNKNNNQNYGKLIPSLSVLKQNTLEEVVYSKFKKYFNMTTNEIQTIINIHLNCKAKSYYANLVKAILGVELNKEIEEFQKADISVKTIRLDIKNKPKEQISFPAFKFEDLVKEKWEESKINDILEKRFLFIFFKMDEHGLFKLSKIKFWNMPYKDRKEVKKVWQKTKDVIKSGNIVNSTYINKSGKLIRKTNFPNKKFNKIAHVRPHANVASDTYPLPIIDKFTQSHFYTKQCFWLNSDYVRDEIYMK